MPSLRAGAVSPGRARTPPAASPPPLRGRTCLVTGCTSGIGEATACRLAAMGATVLAVCRDPARGAKAVAAIRTASDNADVHLLAADLSRRAAIRDLAAAVRRRWDRLHLLVNNAGAIFMTRRLTPDGLEATFAVNHLAGFQLTLLLRDLLEASAPSRVITVASAAHRAGRLDLEDLQAERRYRPGRAYCQSKLANVLFTYELARRLAGTGVTATCLHPGTVRTRVWRESRGLLRLIATACRPLMSPPARAAAHVVLLATSPALEKATGLYFDKSRPSRSSPASYDAVAAARLWEVSERLALGG